MKYIIDKYAFYEYISNHCGCVNAKQSKEERRLKYAIAKYMGCNRNQATRYKDWRKSTFCKRFGYSSWDSLISFLGVNNE